MEQYSNEPLTNEEMLAARDKAISICCSKWYQYEGYDAVEPVEHKFAYNFIDSYYGTLQATLVTKYLFKNCNGEKTKTFYFGFYDSELTRKFLTENRDTFDYRFQHDKYGFTGSIPYFQGFKYETETGKTRYE